MSAASATQVLDELIVELGERPGAHERVIDEYFGNSAQEHGSSVVYPLPNQAIHERAEAAVWELRKSWGPTADSHWASGIIPGRGDLEEEGEFDCYFALFRRGDFLGYVRIRAPDTDTPESAYLRLVFGVVRHTV